LFWVLFLNVYIYRQVVHPKLFLNNIYIYIYIYILCFCYNKLNIFTLKSQPFTFGLPFPHLVDLEWLHCTNLLTQTHSWIHECASNHAFNLEKESSIYASGMWSARLHKLCLFLQLNCFFNIFLNIFFIFLMH